MTSKCFLFTLFAITCSLMVFAVSQDEPQALMILNMPNEAVLPRNFRTTNDAFKQDGHPTPTRQGLELLKSSGSAQFSEKALEAVIHQLGDPNSLHIVDLRQECHGFLNGIAVSWYAPKNWGNKGKSLADIEQLEKELLQNALKQRRVALYRIIKKDVTGVNLPETVASPLLVTQISTEQELAVRHQIAYIRIPVTDHARPSDESVDRFLSFIKSLPKEKWIHFHCAAGVGRTTTFMSMYDMMLNAKKVSFNEIVDRQWALGGLNLKKVSNKHPWKHPYGAERLQFLKKFYDYCQENTDDFEQSWSSYLLTQQKIRDFN